MPGWASHGRLRSAGAPDRLRRRVLRDACGVCAIGGPGCDGKPVEVDHIVPVCAGGEDTPANLQAVCAACHAAKTRGEAARARARLSRRRPPAPRPGML